MSELPGNLTWAPVADAPHLLAPPTAAALAGGGIDAFVAGIDPDLADTAAFCAEYGVGLEESANCVIVAGRRGDTITHAAVLVLATDRADINKTIRKHLGVRKVSFAPMDSATSLTQMAYGGITPIGVPDTWPILIDAAVAAGDWLVVGSGIRGSKVAIRGTDLAALPGAEVLELTLP